MDIAIEKLKFDELTRTNQTLYDMIDDNDSTIGLEIRNAISTQYLTPVLYLPCPQHTHVDVSSHDCSLVLS